MTYIFLDFFALCTNSFARSFASSINITGSSLVISQSQALLGCFCALRLWHHVIRRRINRNRSDDAMTATLQFVSNSSVHNYTEHSSKRVTYVHFLGVLCTVVPTSRTKQETEYFFSFGMRADLNNFWWTREPTWRTFENLYVCVFFVRKKFRIHNRNFFLWIRKNFFAKKK